MKIVPVTNEKNWVNSERCQCPTKSSGTHYFPGKRGTCARFAAYELDGKRLCKQHAGEAALIYLLMLAGREEDK